MLKLKPEGVGAGQNKKTCCNSNNKYHDYEPNTRTYTYTDTLPMTIKYHEHINTYINVFIYIYTLSMVMHIWYQYSVTKRHARMSPSQIIIYHPVSPSCHPLVIPPCTHVMNINMIPLICTCRFPGQVMPLQQPSAGDGGDNVPEQGTSPEQGHHNP